MSADESQTEAGNYFSLFSPQMLIDINTQVASFRDMLIHIGHDKHDCPELRAQIRKTRRACVESCIKVAKLILPQLKRFALTEKTAKDEDEGTLAHFSSLQVRLFRSSTLSIQITNRIAEKARRMRSENDV